MTVVKQYIKEVGAIDEDSDPTNFYASYDGLAVYVPPNGGYGEGTFYHTLHPTESENIAWRSVDCILTKQATSATTEYKVITQLTGITPDGMEQLIAEDVDTSITTSNVSKNIHFDVINSGSTPEFSHINEGSGTVGKVKLKLPLRYKHYDKVHLIHNWVGNNTAYRIVWIKGSTYGTKSTGLLPVYWNMTTSHIADFSKIKILGADGKTVLCHDVIPLGGTNYTVVAYTDIMPGDPELTPYLVYHGDPGGVDSSKPFITNIIYDDFEDGKYTSRNSGYFPWYDLAITPGTLAITSGSDRISGNYSLKFTGGEGFGSYFSRHYSATPDMWGGVRVDFDHKLTNNGTGTYAPWVNLWVKYNDSNNFAMVQCFYRSPNQIIRIHTRVNGTDSYSAEVVIKSGGKYVPNTPFHWTIEDDNNEIRVYLNGTLKLASNYTYPLTPGRFGFGQGYSSVGIFDNIRIMYSPIESPTWNYISGNCTNTPISPDGTPDHETQELTFTRPPTWTNLTDYSYPVPCRVYVDESGVDGVATNSCNVHTQSVCRLGPDGVDKYSALRLQSFVESDEKCDISYSNISYEYEVL